MLNGGRAGGGGQEGGGGRDVRTTCVAPIEPIRRRAALLILAIARLARPPSPQLDAARKEAEAQRKRAAAIEATAATAMTTPFAAESAAHDDDVDAEVDDLLHQLQVSFLGKGGLQSA